MTKKSHKNSERRPLGYRNIERRYPALKDNFKELLRVLQVALICLLLCLIKLITT